MEEGKGRRVEWGVGGGREREEGKRPMKFEWGTGEHFECLEVEKKFDWWTGKFPSKVSWLWFYAACIPNMVLYVTCVVPVTVFNMGEICVYNTGLYIPKLLCNNLHTQLYRR